MTDAHPLDPWDDPLDIIDALIGLRREELNDLRDKLRNLLQHDDPDVRVHAVRRLFVHLEDTEYRGHAIAAVRSDPEPSVRRAAAFAVASTSSAESQIDDQRVLLHVLLNEDETSFVRGAAYEGLLLMHGRRDFPPVNREIDFLRDIDWQWVGSLQASA